MVTLNLRFLFSKLLNSKLSSPLNVHYFPEGFSIKNITTNNGFKNTSSLSDILNLILLAAIWGGAFVFMRHASPEFGPIPLVEVRLAIGALILTMILGKNRLFKLKAHIVDLIVIGMISAAIPFSFLSYATLYLPGGFTSILNSMVPMFTAVIAYFWFKESIDKHKILGLVIGFSGIIILVWDKVEKPESGSGLAVLAVILATICYAFGANYTKKYLSGLQPIEIAAGSLITSSVIYMFPALYFWPAISPSKFAWLSAFALGVFCTGMALMLFYRLLSSVGPTSATSVTFVIPIFGIIWGKLFLNEQVTLQIIVGGIIVLFGTILTTGILRKRKI